MNADRTIQIFNEHCVVFPDSIRLYGQFIPEQISKRTAKKFRLIEKTSGAKSIKTHISGKKRDFCIILPYFENFEHKRYCLSAGRDIVFEEVRLKSPFEDISLTENSAIIITMVKNYEKRILEWIEYHLKLGFSKIVVFSNNSTDRTVEVVEELDDDRAVVIPFNYTCFEGCIYDEIQRMAISIGSNAFKNGFRWTCLIDADEFVYIPDMHPMNIKAFLNDKRFQKRRAVTMQSIVLTNKNKQDKIDNNIIDLCRFTEVKPLYTKTILNNQKTKKDIFVKSPHRFRGHRILPMDEIYHCHCWCNDRLKYQEHFKQRDDLLRFKNSYRHGKGGDT